MKKILVISAVSALALMACTKEMAPKAGTTGTDASELVEMSFTASAASVKTILNNDRSVSFKENEEIAVFAEGDSTPYKFTTAAGGSTATFTGSAPAASKYYAAFPFNTALSLNGDTIEGFVMAKSSDGTGAGTYNSKKAFAVAVTTGDVFNFKQVCALLKITVPAEVTDLKEINIFNRDEATTNTAGALTGNFNVTVSDSGAPTVTVTSPLFQTGVVGPNGSSQAAPAGDYYIPVLPAQLTSKKGIDLKITFMDSFVGRAFSGVGLKLESGHVYNLGTLKKTDEFVENGFETKNIEKFTGNSNGALGSALSVVENPFKTATNPSDWVLKDDMSETTSDTSGYFEIASGTEALYIRFPSSVRGFYNRIRVKMYLGTNEYYPRIKRASITPPWPAKINGVDLNGADNAANKVIWDANVKTDDWNVLEWNASQMDTGWSSFSNLATYQFRPFTTWDEKSVSGFDATTNNRCVYIDDITFVLK